MCKNENVRFYIFLFLFILNLRFLEKRVIFFNRKDGDRAKTAKYTFI